jgi:hypothetical protein
MVNEGDVKLPKVEESGGLIRVDDLVVEVATGKVAGWPREVGGNRIEYLVHQLVEAQRAAKRWQEAAAVYKAALGRYLTDAGLTAMQTPSGRVAWRTRVLRRGRPERVEAVAARYELTRQQVAAIWACAATLDAKKLFALAAAGAIPLGAVEELIEGLVSRFVMVTPARPAPPRVDRWGPGG